MKQEIKGIIKIVLSVIAVVAVQNRLDLSNKIY